MQVFTFFQSCTTEKLLLGNGAGNTYSGQVFPLASKHREHVQCKPDLDCPSLRLPFQVILTCDKLILKTSCHTPSVVVWRTSSPTNFCVSCTSLHPQQPWTWLLSSHPCQHCWCCLGDSNSDGGEMESQNRSLFFLFLYIWVFCLHTHRD